MADTSIDEAGVRFIVQGLSQYLNDIDKANGKTKSIGDEAETSSKKAGSAWTGFAATAGAAFAGFAAAQIGAFATDKITTFVGGAVGMASALAETLDKSRVIFGENAGVIQEWADGAAEKFGITEQAAIEAATQFGGLFLNVGLAADESVVMSENLVQLATDLGSINNLDTPEVLEKIRAGLAGEAEPLRALNIFLSQAAIEAKAMELGLVGAGEEMDQAAKTAATYALILEQGDYAAGNFAETSDGLANSQRILDAKTAELQTSLGTLLLPVVLELTKAGIAFTDWIVEEGIPKLGELAQRFENDVLPILELVFEAIQLLSEPLALFLEVATSTFQETFNVIKGLVDLVFALIQGDWAGAWQAAKDIVHSVIDMIIGLYEPFVDGAKRLAQAVIEGFMSIPILSDIVQIYLDIVAKVLGFYQDYFNLGLTLVKAVWEGFSNLPIVSNVVDLGVEIAGAVAGWATGMYDRGRAILNALWEGLQNVWQNIIDWFSNLSLPDFPIPDLPFGQDFPLPLPVQPQILPDPDWFEQWWESKEAEEERQKLQDEWRERWKEWLEEHPLDIEPPGVTIDVPGKFEVDPDDPSWLEEWYNEETERERLMEKYREMWEKWLEQHPLEITPDLKVKIPDFFPVDVNLPDEMTPRDRQRPRKPKQEKETTDSKPGLKDISDPARFLELVMQAIATIEALANADVAPVSRKKLLALASGLRSIIVEFGNAMRGIKPETAEAAALIATFLDPILDALERAVQTIDAIAGSTGVGPKRIHAVMSALRAITLEAQVALRGIDAAALKPTAATAEVIADLMQSLTAAARAAWELANIGGGGTGGGTVGGGTGGGGTGTGGSDWAAILAGIRGSLPAVGGRLPGAPGGVTYNVVANYSNPASPQSIRLDLEELAMLAVA